MISKNDRKRYIITIIVLIVALSAVSYLSRGKHTNQTASNQNADKVQASSSLGTVTDPKASVAIQQELVDKQQIQAELQQQLGTDQKIVIPAISDKTLKITANSRQSVADYLNGVDQLIKAYNHDTEDITKNLFAPATKVADIDNASARTDQLISALYDKPVPKDAVTFAKAAINTYGAYSKIMALAKQYNLRIADNDVWKNIYGNYAVISQEASVMQGEMIRLKQTYNLQ